MVYYSNYLVWFDIARINLLRTIGLDTVELEREGYGFAAAEANCRYLAPAHFDEELTVRAWIEEIRRKSLTMAYEVVNRETGLTLATGYTAEVLVHMEKGRFEAVEIPADMRGLLEEANNYLEQTR